MQKILVPVDFSKNAKHALRVAAAIAKKHDAWLEILHVNTAVAYAPAMPEYPGLSSFDMTGYYDTVASEFKQLKKEMDAEFPGLKIETRTEEGILFSTLRRVAEEDSVGLIVMGTKGATGAIEFFVGSNTEKVIRTAPCPVLAVPEDSGTFDLKSVVLASTLDEEQFPAFLQLASWQKQWPFRVHILYLNNPGLFGSDDDINKTALDFAQRAGLHDVQVSGSYSTFNEEASIVQFARQENADMIAMGTHQRRGLSHLLFGSLTEDTANHSPIPVLSIPVS
ncbi:MAG: universal stress protein [Lewinellaceae bacterium]|nr:universal stress protein [Saprospiraceae bacterium]MCB9305629.1 universal stress protein [Lewinellaceae bacterium]